MFSIDRLAFYISGGRSMAVRVVAEFALSAGKRGHFEAALANILDEVRAEAGCIEYRPVAVLADGGDPDSLEPDCIAIIESWTNFAALSDHRQASHMKKFRQEISGLVERSVVKVFPEIDL